MKELITLTNLANKLDINYGSMQGIIGLFDKYCIKKGGRYYYKYNKGFLKDLKSFYEKKRDSHNKYYKNYNKAIVNLDILINEIKR